MAVSPGTYNISLQRRADYSIVLQFNDSTGATASGTINTNMPTNTTLLAPRGWMSVGGTSSVIGIALMSCYLETDY